MSTTKLLDSLSRVWEMGRTAGARGAQPDENPFGFWPQCEITGCEETAVYEGWGRVHDPILGKPTGLMQLVHVCEEHKTHPQLVANEKKEPTNEVQAPAAGSPQ